MNTPSVTGADAKKLMAPMVIDLVAVFTAIESELMDEVRRAAKDGTPETVIRKIVDHIGEAEL